MKPGPADGARAGRARRVDRPRSSERPIQFGTSGWRGALGEEVTFPRLRVLVRSVADWILEERAGREVLVGWDNRFASAEMAETAAAILAEAGLEPRLAAGPGPTPAITHALAKTPRAAGLMLTASHNPAADHGLKVFTAWGGSIEDVSARRIEAIAATRMRDDGPARGPAPADRHSFTDAYRAHLATLIEAEALAHSGLRIVYDAMHGSGAPVLDRVLREAGAQVTSLRCEADPRFGGRLPDPSPEQLQSLCRAVREGDGLRIGLATDGDGDRFGAVDGNGRVLSETQVIALLIDQLARAGRIENGVALTIGTGSLAAKVAASHGLSVERHPVGFKHLSESLHAGRADFAGEESGGFAWAPSGFDKDGLLAGCLLANGVAQSGVPLEDQIAELERAFGVSACGRTAIECTAATRRALADLCADPPAAVGRVEVSEVEASRGLRLGLADGGFLMMRASGTEDLLRIYAEADDASALDSRLQAGVALLGPHCSDGSLR